MEQRDEVLDDSEIQGDVQPDANVLPLAPEELSF